MLPRIIDLAGYAEEGSLLRCGQHLGWASKLLWLIQLCNQHGTSLGDAAIRLADHDFGHTDPAHGTVWQLWEQGLVDPLVDRAAAEACLVAGPAESRDWGRGRIIDKFFEQRRRRGLELRRSAGGRRPVEPPGAHRNALPGQPEQEPL